MNQRIIEDQISINTKLYNLGITVEHLKKAIKAGESVRSVSTKHHPAMHSGFCCWAETIKKLRDNLIPLGWVARNIKGLDVVTNIEKNISIAVSSGNSHTGKSIGIPKSKNPKGATTRAIVTENEQLEFESFATSFAREVSLNSKFANNKTMQTWYLMFNRVNSKVYFELSLPILIGEDNRLAGFIERLIFEPIDLAKPMVTKNEDLLPDTGDIVVEVMKKD